MFFSSSYLSFHSLRSQNIPQKHKLSECESLNSLTSSVSLQSVKKAGRLYQPNDCTSWQEFDNIEAVVSFLFQCYTALWVCAFQHNHVICANLGCSVFPPPWVQGALHIWRFCVFTNTLVFRSRLTKKCVLCVCSLTAALVAEEGEKSRTSSCQLFFLDPLCFFFFYQHYWHLFCDTRLLHFHICFCISPFLFTISSIFLRSLDAKKATLSRFL